jgi:large subunit ribosomal protein L22
MVRNMKVDAAQDQLKISTKKSAPVVLKVLNSAVANAKNNNKLAEDDLMVTQAYVDEGPTLKRWRPRAFGRASQIKKRTSHITIVVGSKIKPKAQKSKSKESKSDTKPTKGKSSAEVNSNKKDK